MTLAHGAAGSPRVHLRSRFADVDVDPRDVVTFPDGLPGFEQFRRFVLLDLPDLVPLKVLHAVEGPEPCFLVVDPARVLPGYRCEISSADRLRLGANEGEALVWLAIATVQEGQRLSVNLRAPVVINPATMRGRQVMPNSCLYPLAHPVDQLAEG